MWTENAVCESVRHVKKLVRVLEGYVARIRVRSATEAKNDVKRQSTGGVKDCIAALGPSLYPQRFQGPAFIVIAHRINHVWVWPLPQATEYIDAHESQSGIAFGAFPSDACIRMIERIQTSTISSRVVGGGA